MLCRYPFLLLDGMGQAIPGVPDPDRFAVGSSQVPGAGGAGSGFCFAPLSLFARKGFCTNARLAGMGCVCPHVPALLFIPARLWIAHHTDFRWDAPSRPSLPLLCPVWNSMTYTGGTIGNIALRRTRNFSEYDRLSCRCSRSSVVCQFSCGMGDVHRKINWFRGMRWAKTVCSDADFTFWLCHGGALRGKMGIIFQVRLDFCGKHGTIF